MQKDLSITHKPLDIFFIVDGVARKGTFWIAKDIFGMLSDEAIAAMKVDVKMVFERDQVPDGQEAFTKPPIRITVSRYTQRRPRRSIFDRWNPFRDPLMDALDELEEMLVALQPFNFASDNTYTATPEQALAAFMSDDYSDGEMQLATVVLAIRAGEISEIPDSVWGWHRVDAFEIVKAYDKGERECCGQKGCARDLAFKAITFF